MAVAFLLRDVCMRRICPLFAFSRMKEKKHVCRRCGTKFKNKDKIPFCSYGREVVLGEEDEEWMPEIRLGDIRKDKKNKEIA